MEKKIGGVPGDVLEEIRAAVDGGISYPFEKGGPYLIFHDGRMTVAVTRLGVTTTPDRLGTVTSSRRPGSITNALRRLDEVQDEILNSTV